MKEYLFHSDRLGFRNWQTSDIEPMSELNSDPEVMRFFPFLQSMEQTIEFINKMKQQLIEKGFTYFAVDTLHNEEFIGFIGLSVPTFESDFTPCVDLGWRLKRGAWNMGYATEGAKRCIQQAQSLNITELYAIAPVLNKPSENVMKKTGMKKLKTFNHPRLTEYPHLKECVLYHIPVSGNKS